MKFRRIHLREHIPYPTELSAPVNVLHDVEGEEVSRGILIGTVLIPWGMVTVREEEPLLPVEEMRPMVAELAVAMAQNPPRPRKRRERPGPGEAS